MAGVLAAGADCSYTGHEENSEMDVKELVEFLEGGALFMSSEDRAKEKTAMEQLCVMAKDRCTFEVKKMIERMDVVRKRK